MNILKNLWKELIVKLTIPQGTFLRGEQKSNRLLMFNEQTGALLIPLTYRQTGFSQVQKKYQGKIFDPKQELHITVIGTNLGRELRNAFLGNPYFNDRFLQIIADTDWSYELQNELYHLAKDEIIERPNGNNEIIHTESIVQMVKTSGINELYSKLATILKKKLETPPTHITLFTYGNSMGIGLDNQAEFNEYVVSKISVTDLTDT